MWFGLCVALACGPVEMPPSAPTSLLGEAAPAFSRRDVHGRTVDLDALRGKIVVVEFFARYCEPCWRHLPRVQRWADRHDDVVVIGIGGDEFGRDTLAMVRELQIRFPVVHDAGLVLTARFRVDKIPTTLVLDQKGRVRWRSFPGDGIGAMDQAVAALRRGRD
ncbi:MAG TPA: TlpA disulfide reductase family protein [Nannocystis sp.]